MVLETALESAAAQRAPAEIFLTKKKLIVGKDSEFSFRKSILALANKPNLAWAHPGLLVSKVNGVKTKSV